MLVQNALELSGYALIDIRCNEKVGHSRPLRSPDRKKAHRRPDEKVAIITGE